MAPGTGLNIPGAGDILDTERTYTPVYVKLV